MNLNTSINASQLFWGLRDTKGPKWMHWTHLVTFLANLAFCAPCGFQQSNQTEGFLKVVFDQWKIRTVLLYCYSEQFCCCGALPPGARQIFAFVLIQRSWRQYLTPYSNYWYFHLSDHSFKTSACFREGGVSPCANGPKVTVHKDQKSPSKHFAGMPMVGGVGGQSLHCQCPR